MPFNSYSFLFAFLPITVLGYWTLSRSGKRRYSLTWLLAASVVFYTSVSFISFLFTIPSILIDFILTRFFILNEEPRKQHWRNAAFMAGVIANLLFLGYFKYKNFFLDTSNDWFGTHFVLSPLLLPLGISFLVFQKIAFLADAYSGEISDVRLPDFLLFTLFFPRTVAGPIVHYQEVMPQLKQSAPGGIASHIAVGVCLLSIGLFKKCLIADNLVGFVDLTFGPYSDPDIADTPPTLLTAWVGILSYALQLYFDFSGYSDMALGVARMLGVRLPMNFNSPFKANSIIQFWSRWHITLTRFLTDYIYTPLALHVMRRRLAAMKTSLAGRNSTPSAIASLIAFPTLVTMAISGFWHGAGWQFIVWGLLHGIYLTINQIWRLIRARVWPATWNYERIMQPVGRVLTFGCVVVALVFFRASSVSFAMSTLRGLAGFNGVLPHVFQILDNINVHPDWAVVEPELPVEALWWILALIPAVMLLPNSLQLLQRFGPALDFTEDKGHGRWAISLSPLTALALALLSMLSVFSLGQGGGFVYGQF